MSENLTVPLVLGGAAARAVGGRLGPPCASPRARTRRRAGDPHPPGPGAGRGAAGGVGHAHSCRDRGARGLAVGALVAVGAGLVVMPWVVRNERAVGVAAVSTLSPSSALAGANCARTYQGPDLGSWDFECVRRRPSPDGGRARRDRAGSDRARAGRRLPGCGDRPRPTDTSAHVPRVVAARQARAWSLWDPRDLARRDAAAASRRYGFQVGAGPIEAVLAVVGAVGLVGLLRRRGARAFVLVAPVRGGGRERDGELREPALQRRPLSRAWPSVSPRSRPSCSGGSGPVAPTATRSSPTARSSPTTRPWSRVRTISPWGVPRQVEAQGPDVGSPAACWGWCSPRLGSAGLRRSMD